MGSREDDFGSGGPLLEENDEVDRLTLRASLWMAIQLQVRREGSSSPAGVSTGEERLQALRQRYGRRATSQLAAQAACTGAAQSRGALVRLPPVWLPAQARLREAWRSGAGGTAASCRCGGATALSCGAEMLWHSADRRGTQCWQKRGTVLTEEGHSADRRGAQC